MSLSKPKIINFITSNKNKLSEAKAIIGDFVELRTEALDLDEIQGSSEEIAIDKCRRAAIAVNGPALIEDSALEFHALNGLPGPYIKWFFAALGNDGLNNILAAYEDKSATAICTFAFSAGPGAEPLLFQGRNLGRIVPKRGSGGFAFDPIFEFEGETYAEMDLSKKNVTSDRYKGLMKLKEWLQDDK